MNILSYFLILAFIFFIGSIVGWVIELIFRRFFSGANPERRWINPGFLIGPYLPLYGFSLCVLFLLAQININFIHNKFIEELVLFIIMALVVTFIEYLAGLIFIKGMNIKLWDYTDEHCNIQGIICPKFSFFWAVLSAIYYFLIHPHILESLYWLSNHLSFSFVMGFFYGVFVIDVCYSLKIMVHIRKFANDNEIIVKYELLKENIRKRNEELIGKKKFIFAMHSGREEFLKHLKHYKEELNKKL
ncbi:putative ABC transporter permease [Terrisporobacter petrolearius]|uniref:putative ABC transporter permease n=1 Tax=Terrisporobacter petrolearius TaxID=1460447 RepID=UPI0022E90EF0|nr:putative ABC transporter permease [Terrisporobacter petrolearius]MDU4860507.1 putative ABC transporter permease [Terrisporobacter othiniensis]